MNGGIESGETVDCLAEQLRAHLAIGTNLLEQLTPLLSANGFEEKLGDVTRALDSSEEWTKGATKLALNLKNSVDEREQAKAYFEADGNNGFYKEGSPKSLYCVEGSERNNDSTIFQELKYTTQENDGHTHTAALYSLEYIYSLLSDWTSIQTKINAAQNKITQTQKCFALLDECGILQKQIFKLGEKIEKLASETVAQLHSTERGEETNNSRAKFRGSQNIQGIYLGGYSHLTKNSQDGLDDKIELYRSKYGIYKRELRLITTKADLMCSKLRILDSSALNNGNSINSAGYSDYSYRITDQDGPTKVKTLFRSIERDYKCLSAKLQSIKLDINLFSEIKKFKSLHQNLYSMIAMVKAKILEFRNQRNHEFRKIQKSRLSRYNTSGLFYKNNFSTSDFSLQDCTFSNDESDCSETDFKKLVVQIGSITDVKKQLLFQMSKIVFDIRNKTIFAYLSYALSGCNLDYQRAKKETYLELKSLLEEIVQVKNSSFFSFYKAESPRIGLYSPNLGFGKHSVMDFNTSRIKSFASDELYVLTPRAAIRTQSSMSFSGGIRDLVSSKKRTSQLRQPTPLRFNSMAEILSNVSPSPAALKTSQKYHTQQRSTLVSPPPILSEVVLKEFSEKPLEKSTDNMLRKQTRGSLPHPTALSYSALTGSPSSSPSRLGQKIPNTSPRSSPESSLIKSTKKTPIYAPPSPFNDFDFTSPFNDDMKDMFAKEDELGATYNDLSHSDSTSLNLYLDLDNSSTGNLFNGSSSSTAAANNEDNQAYGEITTPVKQNFHFLADPAISSKNFMKGLRHSTSPSAKQFNLPVPTPLNWEKFSTFI